jgi:Mce-associated membrane protein
MTSSDESRPDAGTSSGVSVVSGGDPAPLAAAVGPEHATWGQRVVAAIFDDAILAGVTWLALGSGFGQPTLTPGFWGADVERWANDPLILVPIGALVILLVLQATTGWTPGKLVVGIRVVRERSSAPAGLWTTLARWALHLLDAILLIGYLRPLWHAKRQTFADTIAHTVVVQKLPDLRRRPRIAVHSAALVAVVLGIGYGCVPISGGSSSALEGVLACKLTGPGPFLTTGDITLDGSLSLERDRRLWTVRETRTAHPGATITWTSDPSVRDARYRVELDARPSSADGEPVVSRSWDIGTGESFEGWSDQDGEALHTRNTSPDGDVHVAEVEAADSDGDLAHLGTLVWTDVRLIADGQDVIGCDGVVDFNDVEGAATE